MLSGSCVVVFSGGQDSTTCLYWAKRYYQRILAVSFDYGQHHKEELFAAKRIAAFAEVEHEIIKLGDRILKGTSPLVNKGFGLEQYDHHSVLPGGLEKTFVPMRNQLFLTIAANRAYLIGSNVIITGVSAEDYGGYPDCREPFIDAMVLASSHGAFTGREGAPESLVIQTPLMHLSKEDTVGMAMTCQGCYAALAMSHTAYDGQYPPTSKDHASLLRAKGFEMANVPDPLVVRAWRAGLMDLPETLNYSVHLLETYQGHVINAERFIDEFDVKGSY